MCTRDLTFGERGALLLVGDERPALHAAAVVLERAGYEILSIVGPREALPFLAARRTRVALVVADLGDETDPVPFLETLAAQADPPYCLLLDPPRGTSPGVARLDKPFRPADLIRAVRALIAPDP